MLIVCMLLLLCGHLRCRILFKIVKNKIPAVKTNSIWVSHKNIQPK